MIVIPGREKEMPKKKEGSFIPWLKALGYQFPEDPTPKEIPSMIHIEIQSVRKLNAEGSELLVSGIAPQRDNAYTSTFIPFGEEEMRSRSCINCAYFSGSGKLACTVNPLGNYAWLANNDCKDWERM